jgi:hypothetical protein
MGDHYSDDSCPAPATHDSHDALAPSRQPGKPATDPDSAASTMQGFDPADPPPGKS